MRAVSRRWRGNLVTPVIYVVERMIPLASGGQPGGTREAVAHVLIGRRAEAEERDLLLFSHGARFRDLRVDLRVSAIDADVEDVLATGDGGGPGAEIGFSALPYQRRIAQLDRALAPAPGYCGFLPGRHGLGGPVSTPHRSVTTAGGPPA